MYRTTFTVHGDGKFPLDMLRYDGCFPKAPIDVDKIREGVCGSGIDLIAYHQRKSDRGVTIARWASFGWEVGHIRTDKVG